MFPIFVFVEDDHSCIETTARIRHELREPECSGVIVEFDVGIAATCRAAEEAARGSDGCPIKCVLLDGSKR